MYSRMPQRGGTPSFGLGGPGAPPAPKDLLALLGVLFVTFSLQFFETTRLVPELLRLTPAVWQRLWLWQVGTYAFVGGGSRVNQDIPPYVKAVGNPMELYGLNSIGLQRAGFSGETIAALKRAYRLFFNSDLNLSQALERARSDLPPLPEVELFLDFVESSERGVPA